MLYLIYLSGLAWIPPLWFLAPSVWRTRFGKPNAVDTLAGPLTFPLTFIAADQVGYCLRWMIFHGTIPAMTPAELEMWSGLYTLSIVSAITTVLAWHVVRRVV